MQRIVGCPMTGGCLHVTQGTVALPEEGCTDVQKDFALGGLPGRRPAREEAPRGGSALSLGPGRDVGVRTVRAPGKISGCHEGEREARCFPPSPVTPGQPGGLTSAPLFPCKFGATACAPHHDWRCTLSPRPPGSRQPGARLRPLLGGWFLLVLFLHSACATGSSRGILTAGHGDKSPVPRRRRGRSSRSRRAVTSLLSRCQTRSFVRPSPSSFWRLPCGLQPAPRSRWRGVWCWPPGHRGAESTPVSKAAMRACASGAALQGTASGSWGMVHTTPLLAIMTGSRWRSASPLLRR